MNLVPTQLYVLQRLIWDFAEDSEKKKIISEVNALQGSSTPAPTFANKPFAALAESVVEEPEPEIIEIKPKIEPIPEVELARAAVTFAENAGIPHPVLAAICNGHKDWPGLERKLAFTTLYSLATNGYRWHTASKAWFPHMTVKKCIILNKIVGEILPSWLAEQISGEGDEEN